MNQGLPQPAAAPACAPDIDLRDWCGLFMAVQIRLGTAIRDRDALPQQASVSLAPSFEAVVRECVHALDRLHASLDYELGRCRLFEQEVGEARAALLGPPIALSGEVWLRCIVAASAGAAPSGFVRQRTDTV